MVLCGAETVTQPFVGVTHVHRTEPVELHVVRIDLTAPGIRFRLTGPGGWREARRRTTLDSMVALGGQVAINGHFFLPFPSEERDSELVGLAASEGVVYSGFERPIQSYALVEGAPALHVDAGNRASIVGPDYGGALWTAVAGSAQILTRGTVTVPKYQPEGVLTAGRYENGRSWYDVPNARTVAGVSKDGRTVYLVTSGRTAVAPLAELLLQEFGVWEAVNLDGGGSTTLAMENPETGAGEVLHLPAGGRPGW
jgi:hypothetical protein